MEYNISEADPGELKELDQAITDFNIKIVPELPRAEIHRLDFAVKNVRGQLLGGIQSYRVNWGILHVKSIYVYDDYRNQGIATALLQALLNRVEKIAREHQCHLSHLDTSDFQAKDFYLRYGYLFSASWKTPRKNIVDIS